MSDRWEYKVHTAGTGSSADTIERVLNADGEHGFRLIDVIQAADGAKLLVLERQSRLSRLSDTAGVDPGSNIA